MFVYKSIVMAQLFTKKQLKELPVIPYEKIRDNLKTGHIFFSSGSYTFSGVIQRLTKSTWSHVAIIYKDEELGRVLVLEAEPYVGIRLIPLSKYLKDYKGKKRPYKGQIVLAKLTDMPEKEKLNKGISFGLDELTRPYDNWEIIRIMLRILFRIGKREKNRNYICSELVRDCFAKTGVIFPMKDSYISPEEIWKDARVEMKYRIL
jgi:Permuted papain-like amidase enzyme, YaeF/YiiX, C92 family